MRLCILQHIPFEDAANIGVWARLRGHDLQTVRLYDDNPLPAQEQYDLLALMGGPMNIYEHDRYPWLIREKQFLHQALEAGKGILGVCLGAQLIADALGGPVRANPYREIGWFEVTRTAQSNGPCLLWPLPQRFLAFHWHGDTFEIPPGASHLAHSQACRNQAFQFGQRVLGLQFHLDYDESSLLRMLEHCPEEIDGSTYTQMPASILADPARLEATRDMLFALLDHWAAQCDGQALGEGL